MIDRCIHLAEYAFPHLEMTAKSRLNAGVGVIGLAHFMAKNKVKYSSQEGKQLMHELAERHYYFLLKASLKLGKELGNAPWMHKTKWADGWLPIDTYNRKVDTIVDSELKYDWETLREEVKANGGIRNTVLAAHMPSESSSKASGTTNGLYPVRDLSLKKGDDDNMIYWAAPEGEKLSRWYELSWDVPTFDMIDTYAIFQKFTDQGISGDEFRRILGDERVGSKEMITNFLYMTKMGMKTRYYVNTKTTDGTSLDTEDEPGCDGGFCTL
jgi:ribonucleoside-diphosphate reductase alpha chain